jgi:hypothetical protein
MMNVTEFPCSSIGLDDGRSIELVSEKAEHPSLGVVREGDGAQGLSRFHDGRTDNIWKANSLPCAEFQCIDALNSVPIDKLLLL